MQLFFRLYLFSSQTIYSFTSLVSQCSQFFVYFFIFFCNWWFFDCYILFHWTIKTIAKTIQFNWLFIFCKNNIFSAAGVYRATLIEALFTFFDYFIFLKKIANYCAGKVRARVDLIHKLGTSNDF